MGTGDGGSVEIVVAVVALFLSLPAALQAFAVLTELRIRSPCKGIGKPIHPGNQFLDRKRDSVVVRV